MKRSTCLICLSALLTSFAAIGCSDSDDSRVRPVDLSGFESFCTGTLKVEKDLMVPYGPGGWQGDGDLTVPAGTAFLLSQDFGRWEGYLVMDDGSAALINSDWDNGLVEGTDFTSDCPGDINTVATAFVVLQESRLYDNEALTGEACVLPPATVISQYSFSSGMGEAASLSSSDLHERCGFTDAHSDDLVYGRLVLRE